MQNGKKKGSSQSNLRESKTQAKARLRIMARIAGIDLPTRKRAEIGLTYIHGIGRTTASQICEKVKVDPSTKIQDLNEDQVNAIRKVIQAMTVEGDLRREVSMNIKRLVDLGCYRGLRHRRSLPVNGQRTKTNARTRKGPKKLAVSKKK